MSNYIGIATLRQDSPFQNRVNVASFEQANVYKDSALPHFVAMAEDVLKSGISATLFYAVCNAPGFGDKAVDSTTITDADILSAIQASWQPVAELLYPDLVPVAEDQGE